MKYRLANRQQKDGSFVQVWEDIDMRIPSQYLKTVFYMFNSLNDRTTGTGFVIATHCRKFGGFLHEFAITNRHMVMDTKGNEKSTAIKVNKTDGSAATVSFALKDWICSTKDDIAALPLPQSFNDNDFDWVHIPQDHFLTQDMINEAKIGEGSEIFFAGRFGKHEGGGQNTPLMRFGHMSLFPETIVNGQPVYIVEGLAIKGFSGSPVFVYHGNEQFVNHDDDSENAKVMPPRLLGVHKGHWGETDNGNLDYEAYNYGIMTVVPIARLLKFLNEDERLIEMKKEEHKLFEKAKEQKKDAPIDDSDDGITREEYEQALRKAASKINPSKSDQTKPKSS